jgi:intein-encoded DNA endonuclease-like protein
MANAWTMEEIRLLKESINYTLEERLQMLPNRSISSIRTKMSDLKLKSINRKLSKKSLQSRRLKNIKRISEIIENSYILIDDFKMAYTLGLLWGDGSIYNSENSGRNKYVYLGINNTDFSDVKHIFDENWYIKSRIRKNRSKIITEARNHNINFAAFLYKNDYSEKSFKSPSKILKHIPDKLKHYFWRGFSDADGCFYISKDRKKFQYALAGSYDQDWSDFESLLSKLDIHFSVRRAHLKKSSYSVVRFCNRRDFLKFGEYIYQGDELGLSRKFSKFIEAKTNAHQCRDNEK